MKSDALSPEQQAVVREKVTDLLGHSPAFHSLSADQRSDILRDTTDIVGFMADTQDRADPYAISMADGPPPPPQGPGQSSTTTTETDSEQAFRAQGVREGVNAAAALVSKVDFPAFVAELVQGTFHAIVQSSIEQMKAYGELVNSVAMSLNEFRDQNVSQNQARDHLVSRYPNLMQINMVNGSPKVGPRAGAEFAEPPDFGKDFGLGESITDLDEETIEDKLVPAARDDLARSRQKLLSTMVLMGINRIIVTDGKINAKVRFNFSARDSMTRTATEYDYENFGTANVVHDDRGYVYNASDRSYDEDGTLKSVTGGNMYSTGAYTQTQQPVIQLSGQADTYSEAELAAAGQLLGEVSINFRSETFPLERMIETDQMAQLQSAEKGGAVARAVPAADSSAGGQQG